MIQTLDLTLDPPDADEAGVRRAVGRTLGVDDARITGVAIERRTVDARRGRVRVVFRVRVGLDGESVADNTAPPAPLPSVFGPPRVIVIGAGPAGLFAAWALTRAGVPCALLERGSDVRGRRPHLARLNRDGVLNAESNYCFGEGGAGTFSDGKLYTRAKKRGPVEEVLQLLVSCGAPPAILYEARPHIGTNRLPKVVEAMRNKLIDAGVVVHFDTRVDRLALHDGAVTGVVLGDGSTLSAESVILATGHSARDVYRTLHHQGVALEAKPYALGVRIEHPQGVIDGIQYGRYGGHPNLGAAPYSLKRTEDGRGVYSFCMCPGGFIVAATTEPDAVVVNGMSPSKRDSRYANSGMVVTVDAGVYGEGVLDGLEFQYAMERRAFAAGGGAFKAPAQRLTDYLMGRASTTLPECSYRPGLVGGAVDAVLGPDVHGPLVDALRYFGANKMRGYVTEEAVVVGVESRSSAPIRIPRERETLMSVSTEGLFPCGEGAGYAGGIVSAAIDGLRVGERAAYSAPTP